jgi:hypothetical protein
MGAIAQFRQSHGHASLRDCISYSFFIATPLPEELKSGQKAYGKEEKEKSTSAKGSTQATQTNRQENSRQKNER